MGDSYRDELKKRKAKSGYTRSSEVSARPEAVPGAEVRKKHLRKSPAGRRAVVAATRRLNGF